MFNVDCMEYLQEVSDNKSVTTILTDPPYKYLENQKLETDFDEKLLFDQFKRICTDDALVALFGRGKSFYRWNTMLCDLGFEFKEEIIWDKGLSSSPVNSITRMHETISISGLKKSIIKAEKVPYSYIRGDDQLSLKQCINDIKRLRPILTKSKEMKKALDYIEKQIKNYGAKRATNYNATLQTEAHGDPLVNTLMKFKDGMRERTIIKENREHYATIHPTQKPPLLMKRLLNIICSNKENIKVIDPFGGSMPVAIACWDMGLDLDIIELDKDYFDAAVKSFEQHIRQLQIDFE